MPRSAREKSSSGIYHIILRGINRQTIFEDDEDRKRFLYTLKKYKKISGYLIYSYCLMGNHIHLLVKTGPEPLGQVMRRLAGSFVYWYNNKYERIGNLFQDRFISEPVESDPYLLTVSRYIHQNPLKAGLTKRIEDYSWSSYHDYISGNGITDADFILYLFDSRRKIALEQFKKFTGANSDDQCLEIKAPTFRITDEKLSEIISDKYQIKAAMIKNEPREKMRSIIKEILDNESVSTRQLARVTGISLGIIWRL